MGRVYCRSAVSIPCRVRLPETHPGIQQALLSIQPLADLDLRLLHRARSADLRPVRVRFRRANGVVARRRARSGPAVAGLRGCLPGVEPKPYIIRFTEDRPNPLYRRVCYTFAWSEVITFAVLNVAGLVDCDRDRALASSKQIYRYAYFPLAGSIWLLGAHGSAAASEAVDER